MAGGIRLAKRPASAIGTPPTGKATFYLDDTVGVAYKDDAGVTHAIWGPPVAIPFIIDGGGAAITAGIKGFVELPFAGYIDSVRLLADQSGSIVVDLWKDTYANYPPTVADTITASAKPTLSSAAKAQDTTLTGWTRTFAAGDILAINIDSATTVQRVTLSITVHRT